MFRFLKHARVFKIFPEEKLDLFLAQILSSQNKAYYVETDGAAVLKSARLPILVHEQNQTSYN